MVRHGNPAVRDWAGSQRKRIQRAVYASGDVCWLCGEPIAWGADPRSPRAPSVDHVVPRSLGGNPLDLANCRLAHFGCNSARGNRFTPRRAARASRSW